MEIKIGTKLILKILLVVSWILFIGLAIDAGGLISNSIFAISNRPEAAEAFWNLVNLAPLLNYDKGFFMVFTFLMSLVAVLKALLFYLIIKILHTKNFNIQEPFNIVLKNFVRNMAYLSLAIGMFSFWSIKYHTWFIAQGLLMPDVQKLNIAGGDVWIFMGIVLLVIAQIIKRGVELQTENDLTI